MFDKFLNAVEDILSGVLFFIDWSNSFYTELGMVKIKIIKVIFNFLLSLSCLIVLLIALFNTINANV